MFSVVGLNEKFFTLTVAVNGAGITGAFTMGTPGVVFCTGEGRCCVVVSEFVGIDVFETYFNSYVAKGLLWNQIQIGERIVNQKLIIMK
jgi:hypothetical protein